MKGTMSCIGLLAALIMCHSLAAQPNALITGRFDGAHFDELVESIERQSGYRFFYDKRWTDSLSVDVVAERMSVNDLLEKILTDTDLYFAIGSHKQIFITKERPVYAQ